MVKLASKYKQYVTHDKIYTTEHTSVELIKCLQCNLHSYYRMVHKKRGTLLLSISSPIIDRFLNFFHWHTLLTICNDVVIIHSTTL